ncbi:MAG: sugar transferase [Caproiciproducens sp.]|nr:sugar transferase [Caproiciproducens sp.]
MTYQALPDSMKNEYTKEYWERLSSRRFSLGAKRVFDVIVSFLILTVLSPFFVILALAVKLDSKGPVFYRQVRVGRYNQDFKIYKFRTMIQDAVAYGGRRPPHYKGGPFYTEASS